MQSQKKETQTHAERETGWEREMGGGINLKVGAGKPDRLSVTLNLSFEMKYGIFIYLF